MEIASSAPTTKQRRKFERIETSNMNNQDTSSINHVSDVDTVGKLSKCVHGEVQTLPDCYKKSIKKLFSQEENEYRRKISDPINHSSIREDQPKMNQTLLYVIAATPLVVCFVGFTISYIICIQASHTELGILYISEIGQDYPESNIITFTLTIVTITVTITLFMRHLVLHQYLRDYDQERITDNLIDIIFWIGLLIPFSIAIIGHFPIVHTSNKIFHFMGVIIFFTSTIIWSILQTKITYYTIDTLCDRCVYYLRYTTTMIILASAFATFIPGAISCFQFKGKDYRNWRPNDGGWICHVISVVGEWLFVFAADFYCMSLAYEFPSIIFYMPVVKIRYAAVKGKMES